MKGSKPSLADEMTEKELADMARVAIEACQRFAGDISVCESAIGAFFMARVVGWRPMVLVHDPRTIAKYERILTADGKYKIAFKQRFEESAPFPEKANVWRIYLKMQKVWKFWDVVRGQVQVRDRTELT
jgi:hypothetical protein